MSRAWCWVGRHEWSRWTVGTTRNLGRHMWRFLPGRWPLDRRQRMCQRGCRSVQVQWWSDRRGWQRF